MPAAAAAAAARGAIRRRSPLHEAAQTRYLNYALSVITSRALPDVRDGLKPVQRRILFTMWQQNLTADVKHRKCAKVVGDVMGNYHPHGDSALYETLVRMAQSFSLRYPLVDGSGNFGSLDGDNAAAMRYTECRLARISDEMLGEIDQATVDVPSELRRHARPSRWCCRRGSRTCWSTARPASPSAWRPTSRRTTSNEVCTALLKLLDNPELTNAQLCRYVKGPDFPTGGQILNSPDELKEIYRTGSGADQAARDLGRGPDDQEQQDHLHHQRPLHGEQVDAGRADRRRRARAASCRRCSTSRTSSTEDVRIALELKKDADEKMVMAYLFKHTPLQTNFIVNLTCLIPTEAADVGRPERLDLKSMLWHFLHFRLEVVTRRLEHELAALQARIHILEGFEKVFDALDEILRDRPQVGRQGRRGAADHQALRAGRRPDRRHPRAEDLSPGAARDPGDPQGARRAAAGGSARSPRCSRTRPGRWGMVRVEIEEIQKKYGDARRTAIVQRRRGSRSTPPRTSSSTRTTSSSCRATAG